MYVAQKSLMVVMPALSWEPTSSARRVAAEDVGTEAKVALVRERHRLARLRISTIESTGPNTSSFMIFIEWSRW